MNLLWRAQEGWRQGAGRGRFSATGKAFMKAIVKIMLKPGVLDPQGKAIEHALAALGFTGVGEVRQGKLITIELDETSPDIAREKVREMCEKLLANTVIEDYSIDIEP
jgi:phosphoribosylformylglycinamidine synthase